MKIGITSYAYRWHVHGGMSAFSFLEKAAALECEAAQLAENIDLSGCSPRDLGELGRQAADSGLELELAVTDVRPAAWEAVLGRCAALGVRRLRAIVDGPDGYATVDQAGARLRELVPSLRSAGLVLCVENHFRFSPAELAGLVGELADRSVRVCLDPLNSMTGLHGPAETIAALEALAATAHVKNIRIERPRMGFYYTGCELEDGLFDAAGFLEHMRGRVESMLYECWMDPLDSTAATLEQEQRWAASALRFMRSRT